MTKRELRIDFTADEFVDSASAVARLRFAVAEWIRARQEEGRPLELMLFIRLPGRVNDRADDLVGEALFNTPEIHSLLLGKVVSVSVRSDDHAMPVRGTTFIVQ